MNVSRLSDLVQAAKDVLASLEDEVNRLESTPRPTLQVPTSAPLDAPRQGPPSVEGDAPSGAVADLSATGEAAPVSLHDQILAEPAASVLPDGTPVKGAEVPETPTEAASDTIEA